MATKVSKNSKENPNPGRRKFLKRSAIVAGAAGAVAVGGIGFGDVLSSKQNNNTSTSSSSSSSSGTANPSNKTVSADALIAYAYLGPQGNVSTARDGSGNITQINYGPLTIQITRNSDGSVSSVQTSVPSDSIDVVDTIVRNSDGSISGVNRAWPS